MRKFVPLTNIPAERTIVGGLSPGLIRSNESRQKRLHLVDAIARNCAVGKHSRPAKEITLKIFVSFRERDIEFFLFFNLLREQCRPGSSDQVADRKSTRLNSSH